MAPRLRRALRLEWLVLGGAVALVAYLALVPLAYLLARTFVVDGEPTLAAFRDAYGAFGLGELIGNSLLFAAGSTALAVVVGTALAYLVERTDVPLRTPLYVAALLPLLVPGILYTIAWIFLASPRSGIVNVALEPLLGPGTFDIFSLGGMIVVEGLHLSPLVFLLMVAAFRSMDPALEESAAVSSARPLAVLRRVTLPLLRPALLAGSFVVLIRALEGFEVPALLGMPGDVWVFTSRIWQAFGQYPTDYAEGGAHAVLLLATTAALALLLARLSRRGRRYETVTGRDFRPRRVELGRWRLPIAGAAAAYVAIAVALPLLTLLYVSTQPFYGRPSLDRLGATTFDNYAAVLSDEASLRAFRNSLVLGIGTATAVVLVMAAVGWIVVRTRLPGRRLLDVVAFLPLAVPGLVLGVAILFVYLRLPVGVYGSLWILFIAYCTRFMPYGMRFAVSSLQQVGGELEEAAHVSGAGWWQSFRRVVAPLLAPGLLAGWAFILVVSIRELSSSLLLYSPGKEVLSVQIWTLYTDGQFPQLAALGVLMTLALVPLLVLSYRLGRRVGVGPA
jgi:iron(III) transport system permease protein